MNEAGISGKGTSHAGVISTVLELGQRYIASSFRGGKWWQSPGIQGEAVGCPSCDGKKDMIR